MHFTSTCRTGVTGNRASTSAFLAESAPAKDVSIRVKYLDHHQSWGSMHTVLKSPYPEFCHILSLSILRGLQRDVVYLG
jgi:hypothetical protein